jgi:hypothetical protein
MNQYFKQIKGVLMKRHVYGVLARCAAVFFYSFFSLAFAQTNKTRITLQHQRPRRAMLAAYSDVWMLKSEDRLDGSILGTGFFYNGLNGKDLGQALGINNSSVITIKPNSVEAVDSRFMVRTPTTMPTSALTFDLGCQVKRAGVMLSYFQRLDGVEEGFYTSFHMPVMVDHRQIKMPILHEVIDENGKQGILDYLAGKEGRRLATNLAEPLSFGKIIPGHHFTHGIADLEWVLGYNFLYDSPHHLGLDFTVVFPTGTRETAEKLFEPVVGSRHYTLGLGLSGYGRMIHTKRHRLYGYFDTTVYWVMKGFETRTLGIKEHPFGQYYLCGKREGRGTTDIAFLPASQILTKEVKVNGLYVVEGAAGFAYGYCGFTFDCGYNLYSRAKEKISLKDDWIDNEYIIPNSDKKSDDSITNADIYLPLNKDVLDFEAATTEEQLTHSLYACFSHTSFESDYPLTLAGGALYEHAHNPQNELSGYLIFFKVGVSF